MVVLGDLECCFNFEIYCSEISGAFLKAALNAALHSQFTGLHLAVLYIGHPVTLLCVDKDACNVFVLDGLERCISLTSLLL